MCANDISSEGVLVCSDCKTVFHPEPRPLSKTHTITYLGFVLDSIMRWEDHVVARETGLRKLIFVFYQIKLILNE